MTQRQTVLGFFDNIAEAQQAVQLLLAQGFTRENVEVSTQTGLNTPAHDAPAEADSSSGRFFSSLFGSSDENRSRPLRHTGETRSGITPKSLRLTGQAPASRLEHGGPAGLVESWYGTLVRVQVQSVTEAKQVADLLDTAGAGDVVVDEQTH